MFILRDTSGDFQFVVLENDTPVTVKFTDLKDIPERFDYMHIIKFVGNVPPPPHSIQDHEQIAMLQTEFNKYLNKEHLL